MVIPASAAITPRPGADLIASSANTTVAATRLSLVLEFSAYSVNGYAAQQYANRTPSEVPFRRRPSRNSPSSVSRSKKIAAAWAAGSESQVPLQPKISRNGT